MRTGRPSLLIIISAVILLLVAGYFAITTTKSKISQPAKEFLVVGTNPPFPPFEVRRGEKMVGFDIDMVARIAKALDRKIIFQVFTEFDAVLPALESGNLDMIASAVTIRKDRDEIADFSKPYYHGSQAILAVEDAKLSNISQPEDFTGVHVAYQEGTTSQFWAEENLLGKVNITGYTPFDDMTYALQLLRLGSIDVIILDKPAAQNFTKSSPGLAVIGTIETGEQYGFVVQEGDPQNLLPTINKAIEEMKETGEYGKLIKKWFGGGK